VAAEHVLVVVSVDPAVSHRANEAVRIALGIIAGENDVTIALLGRAAGILSPEVEDDVDGEDILRHVATLKKLGQAFHVERDAIPSGGDWNAGGPEVIPISREDLAAMVARSDRVLTF
jgi:hypothetical protein